MQRISDPNDLSQRRHLYHPHCKVQVTLWKRDGKTARARCQEHQRNTVCVVSDWTTALMSSQQLGYLHETCTGPGYVTLYHRKAFLRAQPD